MSVEKLSVEKKIRKLLNNGRKWSHKCVLAIIAVYTAVLIAHSTFRSIHFQWNMIFLHEEKSLFDFWSEFSSTTWKTTWTQAKDVIQYECLNFSGSVLNCLIFFWSFQTYNDRQRNNVWVCMTVLFYVRRSANMTERLLNQMLTERISLTLMTDILQSITISNDFICWMLLHLHI